MTFLKNRYKKAPHNMTQIDTGVAIPIQVTEVEETEKYLTVHFKTMVSTITGTTNLYKSDYEFAIINKFINAIDPNAEELADLIDGMVIVEFEQKQHGHKTYLNVVNVLTMEHALLKHFERYLEEREAAEWEEERDWSHEDSHIDFVEDEQHGSYLATPSTKKRNIPKKSLGKLNKTVKSSPLQDQLKSKVVVDNDSYFEEDDI